MRHDKLGKELEIIRMLASYEDLSVDEICRRTNLSRRNLYYYLQFFKESGFILFKRNKCYHIDRRSPFLNKLLDLLQFTEEEATTMRKALDMIDGNNPIVNHLRAKLDRFYDFDILSDVESRKKAAEKVNTIYEAIKNKCVVKIEGYSSPHSLTVRDRYVEPYMLMNNNNDVRCYEPLTDQCKTFRVSRMEKVVALDLRWSDENKHTQVFTDIFMFSSDSKKPIRLRMGQLSKNVFTEEYPAIKEHITAENDNHWIADFEVCDFRGIGRFVLGLLEDIEILGNEDFREYIYNKVEKAGAMLRNK